MSYRRIISPRMGEKNRHADRDRERRRWKVERSETYAT
jgi:hypothetical protein